MANYMNSDTKLLFNDYREYLENLIKTLRFSNHEVLSAHELEEWGAINPSSREAVKFDFEGINKSDAMVCYIGDKEKGFSSGVHLELGFASALKKRIIVLHNDKIEEIPYLIRGLDVYTEIVLLNMNDSISIIGQLENWQTF